eukprot:10167401-Alexandrium_andersonii.AAC.1
MESASCRFLQFPAASCATSLGGCCRADPPTSAPPSSGGGKAQVPRNAAQSSGSRKLRPAGRS